jgi:hypothetical protein
VVCAFDLGAARAQLRQLGIFEEQIEGAPRQLQPLTTIPSRRGRRREDLSPPSPRAGALLPVMMTFAVLLLLFAVTLVALPYLKRPGTAALTVESDPPGALIYVDGRARGSAPVRVDAEAGRSYALRGVRSGFRDDEQLVAAASGDSLVRLHLDPLRATLDVQSDPPGAKVLVDGKATDKLTPATLELPPGAKIKLTLVKDGFVENSVSTVAPAAGERALYHASLPLASGAALLTVTVEPAAANVSVDGLTLAPPAPSHDTFVAPDARHKLRASAPGYLDGHANVVLGGGEHKTVKLVLVEGGTLEVKTNLPAKVFLDDKAVGSAPILRLELPVGKHTLALRGKTPPVEWSAHFSVDKGETVEVKVDFNDDHTVAGFIGEKSIQDKW